MGLGSDKEAMSLVLISLLMGAATESCSSPNIIRRSIKEAPKLRNDFMVKVLELDRYIVLIRKVKIF